MGILPGSGSTVASILAYNEAVRWSKHPEKFGTGIEEGVAAPEFANNAACGGALIPALTLGIPGSSTCAIILAAMISHGMTPGPRLFVENSDVVWGFIAAFLAANVAHDFCGAFRNLGVSKGPHHTPCHLELDYFFALRYRSLRDQQ